MAPQASLWNPLTATDPDSTEITAGRRQTLGVTFSFCQGVSTAGDCSENTDSILWSVNLKTASSDYSVSKPECNIAKTR